MDDRISQLFTDFGAARTKTAKGPRMVGTLTQEGLEKAKAQIQQEQVAIKNGYMARYDDLRTEIGELHAGLTQDIERTISRPRPKDVNEALLNEMRESRAWARMKGILDNGDRFSLEEKSLSMAKDALGRKDEDSIQALRTELPHYLEMKLPAGESGARWKQMILDKIDSEVAATRPDMGEALSARAEASKGLTNLETAINYAKYAIKEGQDLIVAPTWDGGARQMRLEPVNAAKAQ
jgi:hypothetical protein